MSETLSLHEWFKSEVLPLEPALTRYIRRNWRSAEEVRDIRQDIYEKALVGGSRGLPTNTSAFIFTIARNHLINLARRTRIISIELMTNLENNIFDADLLTPERRLLGTEELRRAQAGLERLPPRCQEIVRLRKVEGLSTREVAERLSIGIDAVEQQTSFGMRALTDFMLGGSGKVERSRLKRKRIENA